MKYLLTSILAVLALLVADQTLLASECPNIEPLPHDIRAKGYYKRDDPTHSSIDAELKTSYDASVAPLNKSLAAFGRASDRYVERPDAFLLSCVESAFSFASQQGSLLGKEGTNQGHYLRQWSLATLAIIKFKMGEFSDANEQQARQWLTRIGNKVIQFHTKRKSRNNHFYWALLGTGLTGALIENPEFVRFAEDGYRQALNSIGSNGLLEEELRRGKRAALYHAFAAQPLALYRIFRRTSGYPKLSEEQHLDALLARVREARTNTSAIEEIVRVPQLPLGQQAWLDLVDSMERGGSTPVRRKAIRLGGSLDDLRKALLRAPPPR